MQHGVNRSTRDYIVLIGDSRIRYIYHEFKAFFQNETHKNAHYDQRFEDAFILIVSEACLKLVKLTLNKESRS